MAVLTHKAQASQEFAKKLLQMHQQLTDAAAAVAVAVAAAVAGSSTCCCICPEAATAAIGCTSTVDSAQADARKLQKQLLNFSMRAELDDKKEQLAQRHRLLLSQLLQTPS